MFSMYTTITKYCGYSVTKNWFTMRLVTILSQKTKIYLLIGGREWIKGLNGLKMCCNKRKSMMMYYESNVVNSRTNRSTKMTF